MPSENYDFVPWDSPDDIHKFFNPDDIDKAFFAPLLARLATSKVGQAVASQGVKGALKTGAKNLGTKVGAGLKNLKTKVGVTGGGATEGAASATKTATSAASEAVDSVTPKPDLGAKMPTAEVSTPEPPAAEPAVETPEPTEPSGSAGKKNDYKKVGMQLAQQMQAGAAQRKQAQEQRAADMARRGASVQTGEPMEIAWQLLKDSKVDVSGQHAAKNDPRFWEIMSHYGTQDESKVGEPFLPYSRELAEMTPQVDELLAHYGYEPYYFGGQYGNYSDLGKRNYTTGHLAIFDPHTEAASFGDAQFTDNWRKLHELGHAHGLEDLNHKWGEGRRLGNVGVRTPREMLRAVDWETMALMNQNKLMNEIGLPMTPQEYNRDWNTTVGDAGFRAVTGQFTSPTEEGFVPHDERISPSHAMNAVTRRAEELGLDMDETLRDKRAGARKVASEPMDIAYQLLKTNFNEYFGTKDSWVSLPKEGMDAKPELYGEVADAMNISYEAAGGHAKYKNADDLQEEQKHHRYDMIDNDEDPFVDAAHIYSQREQGFKSSVTAHDGGRESKSALKNHMFENLNRPGHYAETSGAWASVLDREGMPSVTDYDHIKELVNKPISESDNGRYMRDIGGEEREKQIHGTPMREGADWTQDFLQQSLQAHNENKPFFLQDYNFQQGATQ